MRGDEPKIDSFPHIVESSAPVYREAYHTIRLVKDITAALGTVGEFAKLDKYGEEIRRGWSHLDAITKMVASQAITKFK